MRCFKPKGKEIYFRRLTLEKQHYLHYLNRMIENLNHKCIILENQIAVLDNRYINKKEGNMQCSICMENQINTAFIPCGHTFCDRCITNNIRMRGNSCFVCRRKVVNSLKIYV